MEYLTPPTFSSRGYGKNSEAILRRIMRADAAVLRARLAKTPAEIERRAKLQDAAQKPRPNHRKRKSPSAHNPEETDA
jgi:hypothetical protein